VIGGRDAVEAHGATLEGRVAPFAVLEREDGSDDVGRTVGRRQWGDVDDIDVRKPTLDTGLDGAHGRRMGGVAGATAAAGLRRRGWGSGRGSGHLGTGIAFQGVHPFLRLYSLAAEAADGWESGSDQIRGSSGGGDSGGNIHMSACLMFCRGWRHQSGGGPSGGWRQAGTGKRCPCHHSEHKRVWCGVSTKNFFPRQEVVNIGRLACGLCLCLRARPGPCGGETTEYGDRSGVAVWAQKVVLFAS